MTEERNDILSLIDEIGKQEETITEKIIVSPVYYNKSIVIHIHGIVHRLKIPKTKPGWYTFKAINNKQAEVVAPAELDQIQSYLKYLPKIRLIIVDKRKDSYLGVPLKGNQLGLDISNLYPIFLCDDTVTNFSKCLCRYDGANIWFETLDISADLSIGDYLKESLSIFKDPSKIKISGLTLEEKIAYNIKFKIEQNIKEQREKLLEEKRKSKVQRDIEYAGGTFVQSDEKSDHLYVTYKINGDTFNSIVSKDQKHHVITAGICLTDHDTGRAGDSDFDLKALVSVIKEGQQKKRIVKTLW